MAEPPAIKREIHRNTRWALYEAERAGVDGSKQLLIVFSQAEAQRVGLSQLRKKFELFQKLHVSLGNRILFATNLLPSYDKVAVAFSLKSKKKLSLSSPALKATTPISPSTAVSPPPNASKDVLASYYTLLTRAPIHNIKDYLASAIYILRIFWDIHKQGMVHNGICMEGLLVRHGGLPKVQLVDMGDLREGPATRATNSSEGELDIDAYKYASPESTGRTGNPIDQRSDIYSLGVLLYELAAGAPPFVSASSDPLDLIHLHMTQAPPPLPSQIWTSEHKSHIEVIQQVLHMMMEKAPKGRYQSLYGVVSDLEYLLRAVNKRSPVQSNYFVPGKYDLRDEFRLPDIIKLYGRDREITRVVQFMEQFRATADTGVVLVGGASGVGKSSLVKRVLENVYQKYSPFNNTNNNTLINTIPPSSSPNPSSSPKAVPMASTSPPIMLTGKHDRIKHTPYSAVLEAYSGIARRVLMTQGPELQMWRDQLDIALYPNGQVLVDVIPEMETVMGPQQPVPTLPPAETKSRFQRVLIAFLQVFLARFPAILFLDDIFLLFHLLLYINFILFSKYMQWADPATISLVESLATDTTINNLILICAYRNNEVDGSHLFKLFMDNMQRKSPTTIISLTLSPLNIDSTTQLIMDSFYCENKEAARSLAEIAHVKTGGNPFFLGQFLKSMTQEKLIHFNYSTNEWEWDISKMQFVDDNIVDFVLLKIRKLAPEVRSLSQLASCLGNRFDLSTLATVAQLPIDEVELRISHCVEAGFLTQYGNLDRSSPDLTPNKRYKFVHDRVQEAFYVMMDSPQRMETHLKIARLLQKQGVVDRDSLFTVAHHYSPAVSLLCELPPDDPERYNVIDIWHEAAKKAKQSSALHSATAFLRTARKLLSENSIQTDYTRTFELLTLLAECEHSCGQVEDGQKLFDYLRKQAANKSDLVRVLLIEAVAYESFGNFRRSYDTCVEALREYDVIIPTQVSDEEANETKTEVLALVYRLAGAGAGSIQQIGKLLPRMDTLHDTMMEILYTMTASSYILGMGLNIFYGGIGLACKLTFQHGVSPFSANACACFAGAFARAGQWEESYQFSKLARSLQDICPHPQSLPRVEVNVMAFGQWQQESLFDCKDTITSAFKHSLEVGDVNYALYSTLNGSIPLLGCGEHLDDVEATCTQWLSALKNMNINQKLVDAVFCFSRTLKVLKGSTQVVGKYDDDFDFKVWHKAQLDAITSPFFYAHSFTYAMITALIFEDYEFSFEAEQNVPIPFIEGLLTWYEYMIWRSILYLVSIPTTFYGHENPQLPSEHAARVAKVRETLRDLKQLHGSPSLACKISLMKAELARVEGKFTKSQELYEEAIEGARIMGYLSVQAFANEQAMKFYLGKKLDRAATSHFREARSLYFSWGAFAKCKQLETKYSFMMYGSSGTSTPATSSSGLDISSVLRAYQVISSEMDLTKLIGNMVKIVIQNTGAQKGIFVVPDQSGKLFIEAQGEAGSAEVESLHLDISYVSAPPSSSDVSHQSPTTASGSISSPQPPPSISQSGFASVVQSPPLNPTSSASFIPPVGVLQYVYRTKTPVLLDNASQEGMFTYEPHVQANKTKSVLCVPVINQGKVVAILYLENNLMTGAFTSERLELVQLLSSQIGISFENAMLYKTLQSANALLETKNKELMELDHIKDQFLANTSHELRTPLNGIIGLAESLIDGASGELPPAACNNLAMIVNCGRRLANLVNDILDLSALKAGGLIIHPHPTDLNKTLDEIIFLSSHLIGIKDVKLLDESDVLPLMSVDESRIQQVLQNIIGNAIKFTPRGKVVVSTKVTEQWIDIVVTDTGVGIPEKDLQSIFEDFKQVDGSISREVGGTGLGLSIARRLVAMHGGTIIVTSELNKGSVFVVRLPGNLKIEQTIIDSHGQWHTHTHKNYKESGGLKTTTILSVDDDPTNQMVVEKLLAAHFNVVQAMSGAEALDIISNSSKPPDFVLLDVMMPKMSGLEVCEKVREKFPMCDLPIIMVSAKSQPQHIVEGLSKGANDYMAKPINRDELLARIRAQLMICHTCRMVCKNATADDPFFVCDSCKKATTKTAARHSKRSSLDYVTDLVNDVPNTLEILTHVPFGITLYNTDGRALVRNAEARRQFSGLPPDPNPAVPHSQFLPHVLDRETAELILRDAKQGTKFEKNVEVYSPIGPVYHRIFAKSIGLSLPHQNLIGTYVLVVESDVTEWWKTREDANRMRMADRQKSELIFDLAHFLKGPLEGLSKLAENQEEILLTTPVPSSPGATPVRSSFASVVKRMAKFVDQIADYADATHLDESHRPKNVSTQVMEILEGVEVLYAPVCLSSNVTITLSPTQSLPPVMTQPHKLTLLFNYMYEISIKHTKSKSILVKASASTDPGAVVVSFADQSRTVTQEELEEMFNKPPTNGNLAPTIVKKVSDALGVSITFTTLALGGGSSINVTVPKVSLTGASKEQRHRRQSSVSNSPNPTRRNVASPNIIKKKDRMETIPEVSESPPTTRASSTSSAASGSLQSTSSQASFSLSSLSTSAAPSTHRPGIPPSPIPTNATASQLYSHHIHPSPPTQQLPLIPNPNSSAISSTSSSSSTSSTSTPSIPVPSLSTTSSSAPATYPAPTQPSRVTPTLSTSSNINPPVPPSTQPSISPSLPPTPHPNTNLYSFPIPPLHQQHSSPHPPQPQPPPQPHPSVNPFPPQNASFIPGYAFPFGRQEESLEKEIKDLGTKLEMAKTLYKVKKMTIKFKRADQPFFHQVNLEQASIMKLKNIINTRLRVDTAHPITIVKDGDTLVEMDEDLEDGMVLDVFA